MSEKLKWFISSSGCLIMCVSAPFWTLLIFNWAKKDWVKRDISTLAYIAVSFIVAFIFAKGFSHFSEKFIHLRSKEMVEQMKE